MQLRATFYAWRAEKWGEFDPFDADDATRIAAYIMAEHYARFRDWRLAVAAYNQGADGVAKNGPGARYIALVEEALGGSL